MPIAITVPRLGWSMEEGTFAGWLLPHGSTVTVGQPIYSLESDKVTMDVESLDAGTLYIPDDAPAAGATVTVGQLLGHLLQAGEASPRARATAQELGVDLATVTPREGAPRIVEADVLRHAKRAFCLYADADATALGSVSINDIVARHPGLGEIGTVSVLDFGAFGVDRFQGVLSAGQSALLAVGPIAARPVVVDGQVVARLTVPLSLTVDHRAAEPLAAARFLQTLVQLIEAPSRLAPIQ